MTPERWRRIETLFGGALRIDRAERGTWLLRACGDDEGLRAEVARLLDQDEWAERDRFFSPPDRPRGDLDATVSWVPRANRRRGPGGIGRAGHDRSRAIDEGDGFAPKS